MATAPKTTKSAPEQKALAQTPNGLPAPAYGMRQVLQVVSKRDGFRRAGREWHGTTTVALDELTEEQFLQIEREPMLVSMLLEVPVEDVGQLAALGATDLSRA